MVRKLALILLLILPLCLGVKHFKGKKVAYAILQQSCVTHLTMNDDTNNNIVVDSMGNHNGISMQMIGGLSFAHNTESISVAGKIDGALAFGGVDNYIDTNIPQSVFQNNFSVSLWAEISGQLFDYSCLIASFRNHSRFAILINNFTSIGCEYRSDSNVINVTSAAYGFPENIFRHIVVTVSNDNNTNATISLYIDGQFIAGDTGSCDMSVYANTYSPLIGAYRNNDLMYGINNYFSGTIDDVRIYNKVLSQKEVDLLYNRGDGRED